MNDSPLFSIMIANHNDGKYIQEALASVEKQTYKNYEVVIVDDGSDDDSNAILKELESKTNYRVFFNNKNYGCGYTKRKCVELAKGDICGFLDADDALTKDALEVMVESHMQHPEVSIAYSQYYACDKGLNTLYVSTHQCDIPEGQTFLNYKRGAISQFATFKKSLYNNTLGINAEYRIAEDLDLYLKMEEVGKTLFIDRPLYYYRCGTGNNTSLDDNLIKAAHWEIIAKTEACHRRNANPNSIEMPIIKEITDSIVFLNTKKILQSKEYKLGYYLLHPSKIAKNILFHCK
ncbi:MAG: glycosyltransferase [Bacteroidales bacterium]|nr:glycosyltransferase [Bacteroidales bacterium]